MKVKNVHQKKPVVAGKKSVNINDRLKLIYLDALLDQTEEALAFIDIQLHYQHINKAYANWFGYDKDYFTGKSVSEIVNEETFQVYLPNFIKSFQGECVKFECIEPRWLTEVSLVPLYKDSEIEGCICLLKKKSQSDEIINADDFFRLSPGLLCIADIDGRFLKCNPAWERTLGYNSFDFATSGLLRLIHPDEKTGFEDKIRLQDQDIVPFCNRFLCKNGSFKWLEGHITFMDKFILVAALDVSDHIHHEKSLEKSALDLKELNASKDKFFSIISHDLRSPFNNILGITNLLRNNIDTYDKEFSKQVANQLYNSAKMAFELLENLLDWSLLRTNRIEFEPSVIDLEKFLNNCMPMMQLMASSKQISIEIKLPQNLSVYADQNITRTVIRNLISNAVKFSNNNKAIILAVAQKGEYAFISIKDEGVGIPSQIKDKLFRIDTKYTTPGTMNERGTGLGLILCKDFVEKQGGNITVESTENEGSTFTFTIPLKTK